MNKLIIIIVLPFYFHSSMAQSVDYPSATSNWVATCNYGGIRASSSIDTWVNHWVGVGDYLQAISWFKNCTSEASAHFIITNVGNIIQLVPVNRIAWHAGADGYNNNTRSIGVEHEVNISDPSKWNSISMLQASTNLACYFCDLYDIPKERALPGIRGHGEMPGVNKDCPGPLPWNTWMNMLSTCGSTPPPTLDCSNAINLICGIPYNGSSSNAASKVMTYGCNTWTESGPERVHKITTTSTGNITATLTNFTGDLDVYILGSCDPNDCKGTVSSSSSTYNNAPAGTYYIVVDADDGSGGSYSLTVSGSCGSATATISNVSVTPNPVNSGSAFTLNYSISATGGMNNVLLGASIRRNSTLYSDASNDKLVSLVSGSNSKSRSFDLSDATPNPVPAGDYDVIVALWRDDNGNGEIDGTPTDTQLHSYTSSQKLTINSITNYAISTSSHPSAGGTTNGSGTFQSGQSRTVTATANSGYTFTNWTENGTQVSANSSYTFTLSGDRTLVANFRQNATNYTISTSSSPSAGGTTSGSGTYQSGQSRTVTATADSGYTFTNWTENGTQVSANSSYTFTLSGNRTLVANFTQNATNYTISTSSNPSVGGTTNGSGTYQSGQSRTVTATANNGYSFTEWTENGTQVSTNSSYTFTLSGNRTLVANFTTSSSCAAPSVQAYGILFQSVGPNSLRIYFNRGNGERRIIKINKTNSFTAPANGSDPIANSNYAGSGEQVIYNGTSYGAEVTGLSPNTNYCFRIYELNCSNNSTVFLNTQATDNPLCVTTSAPCPALTVPNNLSPGSIQQPGPVLTSNPAFNWSITGASFYTFEVRKEPFELIDVVASGCTAEPPPFTFNSLSLQNGVKYRWCVSSALGCNSGCFATSQFYYFTYNSVTCIAPSITAPPTDQIKIVSESANFSVSATGSNNLYQWQIKAVGLDWINTGDGGSYSGSNTPNLTIISPLIGMNGSMFRCIVSSSCTTTTMTSNAATLTVTSGCSAPTPPATCTTSLREPANGLDHQTNLSCAVVAGADGYSFEYSYDGITWVINWAQYSSNSIFVNSHDSPNIPLYYRVRAYKCTPQLYSAYTYATPQPIYTACDDPAIPTVNGATANSLNVTLNAETPVANPSYTTYSIYCETKNQYVQLDGSLGSTEVFQTKNTWGTKTVTGLMSNTQYCFYVKAKNGVGDIRYSSSNSGCANTLNISCVAPNITNQPSDQTKNISESASFSITATGSNNLYQWQVNTTQFDWTNTGDGGSFSGSTTPNLTVNNLLIGMNGSSFRCFVSSSCSTTTVTSNAATLSVTSANYTISTSSSPTAGGATTGGGTYQNGQSCTVTASANSGYTFSKWTENGTQVSTSSSYQFTVSGNRTLVANFTQNPVNYTISTSSSPTAGGITNGGGTYQNGQSCTVTASANNGYTFSKWTENGTQVSTSLSYQFTVSGNRTLVANFTQNPVNYTVSTSSSPTAGGATSGGGTYQNGQSCTVTASANSGYTFSKWTENGTQVSTSSSYQFTVSDDRMLIANFIANSEDPNMNDRKMIVYPNPTTGQITIVFDKIYDNGSFLIIVDVNGKTVLKKFIYSKEEKIDLSGYAPGVYIIKTNLSGINAEKVILK